MPPTATRSTASYKSSRKPGTFTAGLCTAGADHSTFEIESPNMPSSSTKKRERGSTKSAKAAAEAPANAAHPVSWRSHATAVRAFARAAMPPRLDDGVNGEVFEIERPEHSPQQSDGPASWRAHAMAAR